MMTVSAAGPVSCAPPLFFTLYSSVALAFVTPFLHTCPQTEERDHAGHQRQPEGERPEDEDGHHGEPGVDFERRERPDHATFDAAHAAGNREQVPEHADEEGLG